MKPILLAEAPDVDVVDELVQTIEEYRGMSFGEVMSSLADSFVDALPTIGKSAIILVAGYLIVKLLMRFLKRVIKRSKADEALHNFLLSSIKIILYVILAITVMESLGVKFTPMIAAFGAFGLAISLAMQDILSNIAGGISVLFSRPFSKGDFVDIGSQSGTIKEIGMVYTTLQTSDNKQVLLPNGDVTKATIVNYSVKPIRRTDFILYIDDCLDFDQVKRMISDMIQAHPMALKDPAPVLRYTDQTYAHLKMSVMVWAHSGDLLEMRSQLMMQIRTKLLELKKQNKENG